MSERSTPYRDVFGDTGVAEEFFPRIQAQQPDDRDRFFTNPVVGELLRAIVPDSGEGSAQIALLTYHAYHHWRADTPLWRVEDTALRPLLLEGTLGDWPFTAPAPAGYVQLPRNQLWVAQEAVDGFFWVAPEAAPTNAVNLLLVLGLVEQRAGFTVVELASGPLPPSGNWGDVQAREDGKDFASMLPGGEHLLGLTTAGEVLKLVARTFHHLQGHGPLRDRTGTGGDR